MDSHEQKLQIVYRKVEDLIPYEKNSRTHSDEQIEKVVASIREFGWTNPILIDEDQGIIAGHGRLEAAKRIGMKEVPVLVLTGLTEAQKRAYIIADNKLALEAGWDEDLLREELDWLTQHDYSAEVTGFDSEDLQSLLSVNLETAAEESEEMRLIRSRMFRRFRTLKLFLRRRPRRRVRKICGFWARIGSCAVIQPMRPMWPD